MFAMMLLPLIGLFGMALDLSMIYNRKAELQSVADAAALAAARQLDGTAAGVASAVAAGQSVAATFKYRYNKQALALPASAFGFGDSADAAVWLDQDVVGNGAGLYFVKVGTDAALGQVPTYLMGAILPGLAVFSASATAVAARRTTKVTPLAICALDQTHPNGAGKRSNPANPAVSGSVANNELVEWGFRRGVGYNLLGLSGSGAAPQNFLVDPIYAPGAAGDTDAAGAAPFICSGTTLATRVTGAQVKVQSPFPIANLFNHLNSRFDLYNGANCNIHTAPPDFNIKSYFPFYAGHWMANAANPTYPTQPAATGGQVVDGALKTKADILLPASLAGVPDIGPQEYGPLWSYAPPARYAATDPAISKTPSLALWGTLYPRVTGSVRGAPPVPSVSNYPSSPLTPYLMASGNHFSAPAAAHPGLRQRRVLNIPLLSCPVVGGVATVLAIGKFFMTSPATAAAVYAEFGGLATEQEAGGPPELYQ